MPLNYRFVVASTFSAAAPALVFVALVLFVTAEAEKAVSGLPRDEILILCGTLMISAGFIDWIDGTVARKLGVAGSVGRFLDLYCDAVGTSIPPALIIALIPLTIAGTPLPSVLAIIVGAVFIGAVVMRHAKISEQQTYEGVVRHDVFSGLVTPPLLHLTAGWLIMLGSSAELPFAEITLGLLARENTGIVCLIFALSAVLILTRLSYLRAEDLALRTPWPWWILLAYIAYLNLGLAWFSLQVYYIATPLLLKLNVLRDKRYFANRIND